MSRKKDELTKPKELLAAEQKLFDIVYQWGRVGIKVDATCPTFQTDIDELYKLSKGQTV